MEHSVEQEVGEINRKVTSILTLLKGNDLDREDKGMIGVQNDHEARLDHLEETKNRAIYILLGMGIPAGWGLIDIIQKIFLRK